MEKPGLGLDRFFSESGAGWAIQRVSYFAALPSQWETDQSSGVAFECNQAIQPSLQKMGEVVLTPVMTKNQPTRAVSAICSRPDLVIVQCPHKYFLVYWLP